MSRSLIFITHPDVVIDPAVPVTAWPLSELGRQRTQQALAQPWMAEISAIYCSDEQKAIDTAEILATANALSIHRVTDLGENDRSSTGFLPPAEFERIADQFFAAPHQSVRGWETAAAAQHRIVQAVTEIAQSDRSVGLIAIVSHGAVGTLLYCHLTGQPISRRWDQPPNGGGNYFHFQIEPPTCASWWQPIDEPSA